MKSLLLCLLFALSIGVGLPRAEAQLRGQMISIELLAQLTGDEILEAGAGLAAGLPAGILPILVPTTYEIAVYRVVYGTIDGLGQPTIASGMVAIPLGDIRPAPLMIYHHGTFADDASAPSNLGPEAFLGYAFASDGYVAILPDYLGFGANDGVHPYVHAKTEATASVDMARAVQRFLRNGRFPLNGQLFITGYSQGGHACVATQREIEQFHADEFNLVMSTPGSGPYDTSGVQTDFIVSNPTYSSRGYLPFILFGYQPIYGNLYSDITDVFVPPYDTLVPPLFDRVNTMNQIERQLPEMWMDMFQHDFIDGVVNDKNHPVNLALKDNNLLNFKPETPLIMFFCSEDEQVDPRNAIVAWIYYRFIRGADSVIPFPAGPFNHTPECIAITLVVSRLVWNSVRL